MYYISVCICMLFIHIYKYLPPADCEVGKYAAKNLPQNTNVDIYKNSKNQYHRKSWVAL